jgi:hypothetical protein
VDGIDLKSALGQMGFKAEGVDRIRLARGVVGKSTYVAVATMGVLSVAAYGLKANPIGLLIVGFGAIVLFCVYFFGIMFFASKNPNLAFLEGAELIHWRQMDISAQGMLRPATSRPVISPVISEDQGA